MPGKHHCSCEVEEEIEEIKTPTPVRQRRRSQASMPPHPLACTSGASDAAMGTASNSSESVANESTKRSSGLSVMSDEYLYTSDGIASNGSNTGSLKRRRPVLDAAEASCSAYQGKSSLWMEADHSQDLTVNFTSSMSCNPTGAMTGGAAAFGLSPVKGTTAPVQLQPPLSERELEGVLAVLRFVLVISNDFTLPQILLSFSNQVVLNFFTGISQTSAQISLSSILLSPVLGSRSLERPLLQMMQHAHCFDQMCLLTLI